MTTETLDYEIAALRFAQDAEAEIRDAVDGAMHIRMADLSQATEEEIDEWLTMIEGGEVPAIARAITAAVDQA